MTWYYICTMAKSRERLKARSMRKRGVSIIVIAKKLLVSKSSVSDWCSDIKLTNRQLERLKNNKGVSLTTGQRMGSEANKKKKIDAIKLANDIGLKTVKNLSKREQVLIVTALYWCEGSKSESTSRFVFINSDPKMIIFVKNFLVSVMKIPSEDIVCGLQINFIHKKRIIQVLNFWKNLLGFKGNQVLKPYYVHTKVKKAYSNYNDYYGVCRLIVRRSKYLKYRMLGLIEAIKSNKSSG